MKLNRIFKKEKIVYLNSKKIKKVRKDGGKMEVSKKGFTNLWDFFFCIL